jgi:hypothetical protein
MTQRNENFQLDPQRCISEQNLRRHVGLDAS